MATGREHGEPQPAKYHGRDASPLLESETNFIDQGEASTLARFGVGASQRLAQSTARVSIFGMGYVGAVTSACMANEGHKVVGVDVDPLKIESINQGKSPIVEAGLDELMYGAASSGGLKVTDDHLHAVRETDISLICVGTPSLPGGGLQTKYLEAAVAQIGAAIAKKGRYHSVVVRSTVLPTTTEKLVIPLLERESGLKHGEGFGVSMNPEFLREGVAVSDYYHPPFIVIGTNTKEEFERVKTLFSAVNAEAFHCEISTAEMIKYSCNLFHAVKITFANEIGSLCKTLGVDAMAAMEIVCRDLKLNISTKYLTPGFAFGGSCLPKDLRAYIQRAREADLSLPMLEGALASNDLQICRAAERILSLGFKRVAILGLSFKEGTDDLRESPLLALAEELLGRGLEVRIYDQNVSSDTASLRHSRIGKHLVSAEEALACSEVVVFGHNSPEYRFLIPCLEPRQYVFDLVGIAKGKQLKCGYEGLYW